MRGRGAGAVVRRAGVQIDSHVLRQYDNRPSARNAVRLLLAPERALRTSIYRVRDAGIERVFRRTEVEAYPLLPVLLLGPIISGEGGIGISEGFYRMQRIDSGYDLFEVLRAQLGVEVAPVAR